MEKLALTLFVLVVIATSDVKGARLRPRYGKTPDESSWHHDCVGSRFHCWNGRTIPCTWTCDGQTDCVPFGEDEAGCHRNSLVIGQPEEEEVLLPKQATSLHAGRQQRIRQGFGGGVAQDTVGLQGSQEDVFYDLQDQDSLQGQGQQKHATVDQGQRYHGNRHQFQQHVRLFGRDLEN